VSADVSELLQYASHITSAVERATPELSKVVERGAVNVKRGAVNGLRDLHRTSFRHLKHYPRSISYDMLGPLEAEIGPDSAMPQGGMGLGVELGSMHTHPMPHLFPAGDQEKPRLEKQAMLAFVRALK
jgi:hypothetical protein